MVKMRNSCLLASMALILSCLFTPLVKAQKAFTFEGQNPLIRHIFSADPSARVFNGRLYVYTSHDNANANYFDMTDWHVFSTDDMIHWTDHGAFFSLKDISWADTMAWAPDCVERDGKYYLYYPVERTKIGVAVSDSPVKGFKDTGHPIIDNKGQEDLVGREPIDPTILIDDDGQAYMYFGCRQLRMVKLAKNMIDTVGTIKKPVIHGIEGDATGTGGYYGEGPFIFKRNGLYYLMYSNGWKKTSTLVYAVAKHPEGPFDFVGEVMPATGCSTSHGSLVEFQGQWYIFYHDCSLTGNSYSRSVCVAKLGFDDDGYIIPVGSYENPVLGGDYPDPSVLRDGDDYYLTSSCFEYLPGLTVYHSKDLLNWEPVSYALTDSLGSGWAPDLCKVGDKYYIYFTEASDGGHKFANYVVWAPSPKGPWSKPVNLHVDGCIDPCMAFDETTGKRWLFVSGGQRIQLSDDGLSTVGKLEKVYSGWEIPSGWLIEAGSFEGPKLKKIGQYWYWLSAIGGTAGPATSHSIVVARSKSIDGPWENMPGNPLVHTYSSADKWWSKGHGSLIDTPDGKWYVIYHAYEKYNHNRGRQMMMEPVELTDDGWLKAPYDSDVDKPLPAPILLYTATYDYGKALARFRLGKEWRIWHRYDTTRYTICDSCITIKAQGNDPGNSSPLLFTGHNRDFEFSAKLCIEGNTEAGLLFYYDQLHFAGFSCTTNTKSYWIAGKRRRGGKHGYGNVLWIKLVKRDNIVAAYMSSDGKVWTQQRIGIEVSAYQHNLLSGFLSLLPGIYCSGDGSVTVTDFKYKPLSSQ